MLRIALLGLSLVAARPLTAPPAVGSTVTFEPLSNVGVALRHCDYVCSVDLNDGTKDFQFNVVAPLNGASGALSFASANFPDHLLSPVAGSDGVVGVNQQPNADDATWVLVPGLTDASNFTLVSQSARFKSFVLSLNRTTTGPCHDGPDVVLAAPGVPYVDTQTFVVGAPPPPPPPPPATVTIAAGVATSTLSSTILGCHSDEGFMHQVCSGSFRHYLTPTDKRNLPLGANRLSSSSRK